MSSPPPANMPYSVERWRDARRQPDVEAAEAPSVEPRDDVGYRLDTIQGQVETILVRLDNLAPGVDIGEAIPDTDVHKDVRVEIARMVREIGRAKREIAAIRHPMRVEDHVDSASRQLEAIVAMTEDATNEIMGGVDSIDELLKQLRARVVEDSDSVELIDDISQHLIKMIEACGFQDITGQRITQVVKVLRFIEDRIVSMIEIWGLEAFQDLPSDETEASDRDGEADASLLNGPQLDGQGLSQDDIDALFD